MSEREIARPQSSDALRDEGWRIARMRRGETRIVVVPHVTRETPRAFLDDCDRIA